MYPTWSLADIARAIGRTSPAVKSRAKLLGLKRARARKRWAPKEDRLLRKLYPVTDTSELARRFGCSKLATYGHASHLGLHKTPEYNAAVLRRLGQQLKE